MNVQTTRFGAVADYLHTKLRERLPLEVDVVDGAPNVDAVARKFVAVACNFHDRLAAHGSREQNGAGGGYSNEEGVIGLVFDALGDDGETTATRDEVMVMFAELEELLVTDPTMGGVVDTAFVGPSFLWSAERIMKDQVWAVEVALRVDVTWRALI